MNKVVLIGRLTKDPELRFTPGSGAAVTSITIAIDRYNNKTGEREADFIPVVIWGKQAENTANYMTKGKQIAISGRIQTRSYEAKDGTKRYVTEVVAEAYGGVQFLDSVNKVNQDYQGSNNYGDMNQDRNFNCDEDITPVYDEEMPF